MIERLTEDWHMGTYRHFRMLLVGLWKKSLASKNRVVIHQEAGRQWHFVISNGA
jgi:hypothetical protein